MFGSFLAGIVSSEPRPASRLKVLHTSPLAACCVHAVIEGPLFSPPSQCSVSGSFLEGVVFTGVYSDTTPRWYRDVGRPIVISMFINTLLLHAQVG